jgi:hypothetical protein
MHPRPAYRVTAAEGTILLSIAFVADGIQILFKLLWFTGFLIPVSEAIGWAVSGLAIFLLTVGFMGVGVKPYAGSRQQVRTLIAMTVEGFPLGNLAPAFTIWAILTVQQSRAEDREKAAADATIAQREGARKRGMMRRARRESGATARPSRRMRPALRSIPNPAFKAASAALTTSAPSKPGIPRRAAPRP